jgi:hypothetical protein
MAHRDHRGMRWSSVAAKSPLVRLNLTVPVAGYLIDVLIDSFHSLRNRRRRIDASITGSRPCYESLGGARHFDCPIEGQTVQGVIEQPETAGGRVVD